MPSWKTYLLAAALIALSAFALGQWLPGAGVPFAILATTLWVAFAHRRHGRPGRTQA